MLLMAFLVALGTCRASDTSVKEQDEDKAQNAHAVPLELNIHSKAAATMKKLMFLDDKESSSLAQKVKESRGGKHMM